jgi:TPR repeat protein
MAGGLVLLAAMTVTDIAQAAETAVEPTPAQAHLSRGQELIARGDLAAAATALREALRLDPELVQARSSLGLALYGMGDLDGAVDELRGLLRRHPHVLPARLHLASALMARQDWAGARSELEEVLRRQRDLPQAHYSLAVVRYTVGDLPGAVDSYRQVLALDPGHHDARYGLGLMLKLARRDAEAATELLAAAQGGHARAQYFLGNAYAGGLGVERNLPRAIAWWFAASEAGVAPAEEALAHLRQVATGRGRRGPVERPAVEQAFREFRAELWQGFPDLARDGDDSVGATLVRAGRAREGVPLLIREAGTLNEPAQRMLETLYERGVEGQLEPYDPRILSYLRTAAAEGQVRPRIALARIYGAGLGVPKDVAQAVSLLRATPHEDAQLLLQELSGSR